MKTVYAACGASLALGLLFVFVRAPHPWGWEGIDQYHQIALTVARGQPFPTLEVPWGYAYFLAGFYRLFGDRPWIPLVVQVLLNAAMPLLVFAFARTWVSRREAVVASVLTGLFSFNTVYASTQSSDSVCTVVFMAAMVVYAAALRRRRWLAWAACGLLAGIAPQFRPNLILVPLLLAAYAVVTRRTRESLARAALLVACSVLVLMPWIVRNYRLTRTILPTSVHGGVQLWYGTLQVGPYLNSRAYNPRSVFESPAFDYTSLAAVPIVVRGQIWCDFDRPERVSLVYWSDVDPEVRRVGPASAGERGRYTFEIPAPGRDAVIYYYFDSAWPPGFAATPVSTPPTGRETPFVYFVSQDHLGDLDVHGDLLDVFDVVRLARHAAWNEPIPFEPALKRAGIFSAPQAAALLLDRHRPDQPASPPPVVDANDARIRLSFADGSFIDIPREWRERITDLTIAEGLASAVMTSHASLKALAERDARQPLPPALRCAQFRDVDVNDVFYRREPHLMRRYSALALDNIRRAPAAFAVASAYRAVRLFIIAGSEDRRTSQQFAHSGRLYALAMTISLAVFAAFVTGVIVAWRRGYAIGLPLMLIAYIPLTLAAVLTNMRYTVTVQPLMFMFIAVAVTPVARRSPRPARL